VEVDEEDFFHLLDLSVLVLSPSPLVIQNYHTGISDLCWSGTYYKRGKGASTTGNPTGKTDTFHQPNDPG
jgi:hypothetical protein